MSMFGVVFENPGAMRMPFIEFVGPPGSGKTTAAKQLLSSNQRLGAGRRTLGDAKRDLQVGWLGVPYELSSVWRIFIGFPRDFYLVIRFALALQAPLRTRLKRTIGIWVLLVKSRLLSTSKDFWVIDQGLQQFIVTCRAYRYLQDRQGSLWRDKLKEKPYGADKLHHITLPYDVLYERLSASEKHLKQAGELSLNEYACRHIEAYAELWLKSDKRAKH